MRYIVETSTTKGVIMEKTAKQYSFIIRKWYVFHPVLWPTMLLLGVTAGQWLHTMDHAYAFITIPAWLGVYALMSKRRNFKAKRKQEMNKG